MTSSLPAVILLIAWWKRGKITVRDVLPLIPFFVVGLWASSLTAWIEKYHVGARGSDWSFSALERCLIAGRALWFYAGKLAFPTDLMFIYPRWRIDAASWRQYVYPFAVLAVVIGLWVARRKIGRGPLTAVLFFCGTLVPALGFFNVYPMRFSFVADHFQYLASLGLIVLASAVGARVLSIPRVPAWGRGVVAGTVLVVLGGLTLARTPAFFSEETIWRDTLDKNPTCCIANNNLGQFYRDQHELDKARPFFETAIRFQPDCLEPHYNLGVVMEEQGDFAGAERELARALSVDPNYWKAHFVLGLVRKKQGRPVEAAEEFRATLRINPDYLDARKELDRIAPGFGSRLHEAFGGVPSD